MDVVVMGFFGVAGYLMRKFEYEPAPFVLAFILGNKLEVAVRQTLIYSQGNLSIFVNRPVAAGLLAVLLILILYSLLGFFFRRKTVKQS